MASRRPGKQNNQPAHRQPAQSPTPKPQEHGQIVQAQWSGPLPPPRVLEAFNEIIPNGAERIMAMVEQEQAGRITHNQTALSAEIRDVRRGRWMGWSISIVALAGSVGSVFLGAHPTVSIALVSLPIVALIKAFLNKGE